MIPDRSTAMFAGTARRGSLPLIVALFAAVAFIPIIFLRYAYHDSWAWLYYFSTIRTFDLPTPCVAVGGNHELMGKPLMTSLLCALTAFGPVIDRIWIPRLIAFAMLMGSGALLVSVFRQARVNMAVASLSLLSLLLLPGTTLMISWMATNPIACAVFASVLAGWLWLRYLRHPRHAFGVRLALSLLVLLLLVAAMFTYQVVALFFFVPLMIEILFTKQESNWRQLMFPALAVATFGLASICYVVGHKILLHEFHYFFLSEQQVSGVHSSDRNVAFLSPSEIVPKLDFLVSVLLPRVLSLWFVSAAVAFDPNAAILFGVVTIVAVVTFTIQARNVWRALALFMIFASFYAPFLASNNLGNGLFTNERVKMFMQVPHVLLVWWLIGWIFAKRWLPLRAVAGLVTAVILVGCAFSWLAILRARVIPNYMELKHVEYRLKEAIRQDAREIYIIKAEDRHLRLVLGNSGGREEFGRITSFYFPQHMIFALMVQMEGSKFRRKVVDVDAAKGDTIKPAAGRMIIDMRKFP